MLYTVFVHLHAFPRAATRIQGFQGFAQAEAAELYAAEVYPDMVSRHRGRSERSRSGVATYNSQVISTLPTADLVPPNTFTTEA